MNFKVLFILIILIFTVCTLQYNDTSYSGFNIYSIISPNLDTQKIVLDSIIAINNEDINSFISDADVYINNNKLTFMDNDSLDYYIFTDSVLSGQKYTLDIYHKTGSLSLETEIPRHVDIIYPFSGLDLPIDSFAYIVWNNVTDYYILDIYSLRDSYTVFSMVQEDTVFPLFSIRQLLSRNDTVNISVIAPDSNMLNNFFGDDNLGEHRGVFGSYTISTVDSVKIIK
ncbi:MAG: hypothetical protein SVK54_04685 [candidate division WOR-3 bacterium]|nr:hypothetical protein [candidate division WOR-3 bacterium]